MLTISQFRAEYISAIERKRAAGSVHWAHASDREIAAFVDGAMGHLACTHPMGKAYHPTMRAVASRHGLNTVADLRRWYRGARSKVTA